MRGALTFFLLLILLLLGGYTALPKTIRIPFDTSFLTPSPPTPSPTPLPPPFTKVMKVVDGDTVEIENGKLVRYIGIDTPETKHPTKGVECFGKEASEKNKELVEGKVVKLEKDISETDRYGRLLRYVYLQEPTATAPALFINEYLVKEGYAHAVTFPPDIKYSDHFLELQKNAREQKKGLWEKCQ